MPLHHVSAKDAATDRADTESNEVHGGPTWILRVDSS